MHQRIQSVSRSSSRRFESFNRYFKPGQLRQLRDSKIIARSHKLSSPTDRVNSAASAHSGTATAEIQIMMDEHFPGLTKMMIGPHCLRRKKLVASKSVILLNLNPSAPISEPSDPLASVLSADLVVAH